MTNSIHLGLPYLDAAQAQKHVTHNDALRVLDALVQLSVTSRNVTAAPASPVEGGRWLVGSGATGTFAANTNNVAAFQDGTWRFFVPQEGWQAYVESEGIVLIYDGAAWADLGLSFHTLQNLAKLGIGTTADATNILAAKLNNALFTAKASSEGGSGDMRQTLSKSSASNTVSQLYQDSYSGRAEVGLTGDDNFHFKVSPNGSTWYDALILSNAAGDKFAPAGGLVLGNNAFFSTASSAGAVTPLSQVQGTGANASLLAARFSNDAGGARLFLGKSRGATVATQGAVVMGDDLGGISLSGSDGSAMRHGASIRGLVAAAPTAIGTPTKLVLSTSDGAAAPADRVTIDQSGNLAIGSANAQGQLTVCSNSAATLPAPTVSSWTSGYFITADGNGCLLELHAYGTGFPGLNFRQARGTAAARAATQANDIIAFFGGAGYGTTSPTLGVAQARFVASQTFTDTSAPARVEFWTTPVGSTTIVEAARFNEAGNLLIGNTGGTDKLTVGGNAVPSSDNVYSCGKSAARWSAIWSATGTIQTSDARDKDIVERVSSTQAASIVDSVEPIKFRWKVGGYNEERTVLEDGLGADGQMTYRENVTYTPKAGARVHAGFIAQEIKTAMDANGGDFGAWGLEEAADGESRQFLRPDQLIAILWQALRVTRHELAELKAKIARP